ncbi:MAG: metallophosphoesterase [Nanoarchaeota archaeon]|nr:metallophosphoesterase [Nanoarchaeota archaeon]
MTDVALEVLAISDIHYEFLPFSPKKTIERMVTTELPDVVVNHGDNSGKYGARVRQLMGDVPYLSVLGNHDAIGLEINLPSKPNKFLFGEMSVRDKRVARRYGYGVFNDKHFFSPIKLDSKTSEFRMYISSIRTDIGNVGIIYRHYPFFFDKGRDVEIAVRTIQDYNLEALYVISGHLHMTSLRIKGIQKDIRIEDTKVPVCSIILPPFTRNDTEFYAATYKLEFLYDGSLNLRERYIKRGVVREKSFGNIFGEIDLETEIEKGELLVRA